MLATIAYAHKHLEGLGKGFGFRHYGLGLRFEGLGLIGFGGSGFQAETLWSKGLEFRL